MNAKMSFQFSVSDTSIENTDVVLVILLGCHLHVQWQAASDIVGVTHSDSWLAFTGWNVWQETSSVTLPLSHWSCCAFWREATGSLLTSWIKSSRWAVTLNGPFLCRLTSFGCGVMWYVSLNFCYLRKTLNLYHHLFHSGSEALMALLYVGFRIQDQDIKNQDSGRPGPETKRETGVPKLKSVCCCKPISVDFRYINNQ